MNPDATDDPWRLFEDWYQSAVAAGVAVPEALTLATVGLEGRPAARVVLFKGRSGEGLRFFTNYASRKGRELEQHAFATAVFHWAALGRQVRVEGAVEKLDQAESNAYFAGRPRESQLGAWASPQSEPLASRDVLEQKLTELRLSFAGNTIPRPPHWGGYRLVPDVFEFWTASEFRLNERWLFRRVSNRWQRSLLAP